MTINEYLQNQKIIADGSFGTYYAEKYQTKELAEKANDSFEERVLEIHTEYIQAGAKLIRTNTFASNTVVLETEIEKVKENVKNAVRLAKAAVTSEEKTEDGMEGNQTLVYYSIGNFINATSGAGKGKAARMLGAMAEVTIVKDENTQETYISEYGVEPLVTHNVSGSGQITTYKLSDYTDELAEQNEMKYQDYSFSKAYCEDICSKVFGELYIETQEGMQEDDYSAGE